MSQDHKTRSYFNSLANSWGSNQPKEEDKIVELLSRLTLNDAEMVLDVGCGTGILFPHLEKLTTPDTKLIAIDYAQSMTKVAHQNRDGRIHVLCADAQHLPFHDNMFDVVVAFHVFPHIKDQTSALKEFWRVLKPGRELAIIHLQGSAKMNDFHASLGGAVEDHILLSAVKMGALLRKNHFFVLDLIDNNKEYFVRGVKLLDI